MYESEHINPLSRIAYMNFVVMKEEEEYVGLPLELLCR